MKSRRIYPILAVIGILFFVIALIGSMYHQDDSVINNKEKNVKTQVIRLISKLNTIATDPFLADLLSQQEKNNSFEIQEFIINKLPASEQSSLYIWKNNKIIYWNLGSYELYTEQAPYAPQTELLIRGKDAYMKISHPATENKLAFLYIVPLQDLENTPVPNNLDLEKIDSLKIDGLLSYLIQDSSGKKSQFVLILYLFGYLFLLAFIFLLAHRLARIYQPKVIIAGLLVILFLLRGISQLFPLSNPNVHEFFQPEFLAPHAAGSMADWLLNILTGFVFALFFYIHFPRIEIKKVRWQNQCYTFAAYLVFCICAIVYCFYVNAIIQNRPIHLDINIIENLTIGSLVLLVASFLYLLSFFIISMRLFISVQIFEWPWLEKMGIFLGAVLVSVLFLMGTSIQINIWLWVISMLIIMLLFDLFLDSSMRDFTWVSVWLLIISLFSTVLFFHFYKSELRERSVQALTDKITIPDQQLIDLVQHLKSGLSNKSVNQNTAIYNLNDALFVFPLIRSRYNLHITDQSGSSEKKVHQGINYSYNDEWPGSYTLKIGDHKKALWLEAKETGTEIGFTTGENKYGRHILYNTGDWSVYHNRRITNEESLFFPPDLDFVTSRSVQDTQFIRDNTIYTLVEKDDRAALGRQEFDGLLQPMSFFSFNFILSLIVLGMLLLIHRIFPFLPEELHTYFIENISIRNKIQFSVLAILIAAFTMVGIVSANFYKRSYKETLESTVKEYYQKVKRAQFEQEEVIKVLEGIPGRFVLFNQDGKAIESSNSSYSELNRLPYSVVRKINLSQTLERFDEIWPGALVLPFSMNASQSVFLVYPELKSVPDGFYRFINLLLNAFVFLLLISSALSFSISNTIISPLTELGDKLKDFSLGKRNEPISWKQPDELGALIQSYNEMIEKLEQSAELLAHSEREVAWREMAKQVAHEIKNPLTPMKLSIQHMEYRIREAEEEEAKSIVKHVSKVLVEQIDNLSLIAGEFSSFAKLPKPEYEEILLNDLVTSVYDLFRTRANIKFNLYVPIDELMVQADRTHLIRVMNNLMKNAVQSIPRDREGHIVIRLKEHNGHAIVMVEDNGKGIEDHLKEKVFFPNFTTKSSGTGLGLAICKNIIETFSGTIYYVKNKPEGTVFIFELPLVN